MVKVMQEHGVVALEVMHLAAHPSVALAEPQVIGRVGLGWLAPGPVPAAAVLEVDDMDRVAGDDRRQFGVSSPLLLPLQTIRDNSVSVRHYCFPCIKSVSWIHGKTSKTDRR